MFTEQPLSRLSPGWRAKVTRLDAQGPMRRRFQDLGLIPGTTVECLAQSPLKDPCAYLIRGAVIALRNTDAASIITGEANRAPCAKAEPAGGRQEAGYGAF